LDDSESRYNHWEVRHEQAWAKVLDFIYKSRNIEESSLASTDNLKLACCYFVAYLAYRTSDSSTLLERAQRYYSYFEVELTEVRLNSTSGELLPASSYRTIHMVKGD